MKIKREGVIGKDETIEEKRAWAGIYNSPMSVCLVCTLSCVQRGEREKGEGSREEKGTNAFIQKYE